MRACHSTQELTTGPQLPEFEPAAVALLIVDTTVAELATPSRSEPHPAPPPQRPAAPS
jgi:hypothetical protein